ncbi:hypothetical protein Taro_025259 [Colocasia esculenta]|uniref:Uncharacterized protein n=1 Tax=Colocasia esculenta TaxID=4460 RepID=A0A843VBS1_COLES|nr:hypothetical protein [Colocasia esculenta]
MEEGMLKPQLFLPCFNMTSKSHRCINTLHQTLGDELYILLGSCEGALGSWVAEDQAHQALLLPHCVLLRPVQTVHLELTKGRIGAVDSQEGAIDRWQQIELRFTGSVGIYQQQQEGCRQIHTVQKSRVLEDMCLSTALGWLSTGSSRTSRNVV